MSSEPLVAPRHDMLLILGRTVGAMVCAGFGAYSAYWWMVDLHGTAILWMPAIAFVTVSLLLLSITQFVRLIRGRTLVFNRERRVFYRIWFSAILTVEVTAIVLGGPVLSHLHRSDLYPNWVDGVVGIHFLPLGKLFQMPLYYLTGVVITLSAGACLLISDSSLRAAVCSAGTGLALWLTAGLILYKNLGCMSQEDPQPTPLQS